jgi:hypothetical protein
MEKYSECLQAPTYMAVVAVISGEGGLRPEAAPSWLIICKTSQIFVAARMHAGKGSLVKTPFSPAADLFIVTHWHRMEGPDPQNISIVAEMISFTPEALFSIVSLPKFG